MRMKVLVTVYHFENSVLSPLTHPAMHPARPVAPVTCHYYSSLIGPLDVDLSRMCAVYLPAYSSLNPLV